MLINENYVIGWFLFQGKTKRKRFQFRFENDIFQIKYKNLWFDVKESDFLKDI